MSDADARLAPAWRDWIESSTCRGGVMGTASGARPQRATWLILLRPPDNASGVEADHCLTRLPVVVDDSYRSAPMFAWVEGVGFKGGHVGECLRV